MRIAVWHNLPSGGGKRALFEHVRGLVERNHYVEVWCPPTADREFLPLKEFAVEHVAPLEKVEGRTFSELAGIRLKQERLIAAMDAHCARCAAEIAEGGFDVLFANSCQFYRATSIGRFSNIPSVLYQGEPYRWLYEAMPHFVWAAPEQDFELLRPGSWKSTFYEWKRIRDLRLQVREEIKNARAYNRILVNSYYSRESILKAYGCDAKVCYLGIDTEHFVMPQVRRRRHFIGVGAFTPEKNPLLAVRAVSRLPSPRPALVWISNYVDQGHLAQVRKAASDCGVELDLRVGVSDRELIETLGDAIAMIYAPRLEPFGLAPLEANASGVPVVAVAEGGVRETVRDGVNGLLVDPSEEAIARGLQKLLDEDGLARSLGDRGREEVISRWSLSSATDRLERHLYEEAGRPTGSI